MTNTNKLKKKIKKSGLKKCFICEKLGISMHTLDNKISGKSEFKQSEIMILKDLLHLTEEEALEIFFAQIVDEISTI